MKRHNISLITILLLSGILIITGCKNNTKVASEKLATKSIIETKTTDFIREAPTASKETETIVSDEENENIEYIEKVFKKTKDKLNINILINDANDRNYNKIYEDLIDGKYENTINNFIDNYEGIFNDIKVELNKAKYKDFNKSLANKLKDSKYDKIKSDIEKVIKKYNKETKEVESLIKRLNFKTLILNLNKGKYKSLVNEIKKVIFDSKYDSIREDFINEFVEGEYTEITYDFIYNLLDITYKYKINIVEETIETTKEIVVEETINEVDEVKENKIPIIPIAGVIIIFIIILITTYIIINRKRE